MGPGEPRALDLLLVIQQVQADYIEDAPPEQVFGRVLERLLSLMDSQYGFVAELQRGPDGAPYLDPVSIADRLGDPLQRAFLREAESQRLTFTNLKTLFGAAITSGKPVISNDPAADPRSAGGLPAGHPPLRSFLGLPLRRGERLVGMVGIANRPGGYDEGMAAALEPFCTTCAGLIEAYRGAAERRRMEQALHRTERLESLGLLAGRLAHDFNNLLVGVQGHAELALLAAAEGRPVEEDLRAIVHTAERMASLTGELLRFASRAPGRREVLELGAMAQDVLELVRLSLPKSAELSLDLDAGTAWVDGDPAQLRQLLLNLVTNAAESLKEGRGTLRLRAGTLASSEGFCQSCAAGRLPRGACALLEVADTGVGIEPESLGRIFDPFFTTKAGGQGLGLAGVPTVVASHGGALCVRSAPGAGSSFTLVLPLVARPEGASQRPLSPEAERSPGRILLVEDDELVCSVTKRMLASAGFAPEAALGGERALQAFSATPDGFAAAVVDWSMPTMNGAEVLRRLRQLRPDLPVLFVTGAPDRALQALLAAEPRVALLPKPFSGQALVAALRAVMF